MIKNSGKFNGAGLKALEARIRAIGQKKVVVGVPAATNGKRDDGLSNATIAAAHEFGVPGHIPERSFLLSTLRENKGKATKLLIREIMTDISQEDYSGRSLAIVGEKLAGEVKRKIQTGISPALDLKTIKRKGSSKPLIDTGNLIQSITYEVRDKWWIILLKISFPIRSLLRSVSLKVSLAKSVFLSALFSQPVMMTCKFCQKVIATTQPSESWHKSQSKTKSCFTGTVIVGALSVNRYGMIMAITTLSQLDMRAVRRTIAEVSQLREELVIDGDDGVDVSDWEYFISVSRLPSEPIGTEIKFDATNEKEIVTSTYETSISINSFGRNAYLIIEKLSTSIRTSYAQQLFKRIGVGVVRSSQIRNLPTAIAGGKEQRAQFDLVLSHIHRIEAPLNRGESVVITTQKD
nr:hypothetical protein [Providencia stuartii]